jgi:predicted O-methyltransferase YrrM
MILDFEQYRDGASLVPEEGELLYALVRCIKPEVCVETGTHKTLSTHYIAKALEHNNKGHVWTCDPFDWEQESNLRSSPLKSRITYQKIKGIDLQIDKPIDFFFCDGYHEKEEVLAEIDYFLPKMSEHGIIVFHDCDDCPESWEKMVNGAIKERGLKTVFIQSKNRMRIFEKSGI